MASNSSGVPHYNKIGASFSRMRPYSLEFSVKFSLSQAHIWKQPLQSALSSVFVPLHFPQ